MTKGHVYLKEWRVHAGLRQRDLARALDVDPAHVSRLEKQRRDLKVWHLEIIAKAVGAAEVADLFHPPPESQRGPYKYVGGAGRVPLRHQYQGFKRDFEKGTDNA